uniref:Heat shock transcription factor n=1 Tax=Panagrellus redivivus TaxID=6233 RepID=A0A7E4WD35_PANRE
MNRSNEDISFDTPPDMAVENSPPTTPRKEEEPETSLNTIENSDSKYLIPELELALLENDFDLLTADLDEMMKAGQLFDLSFSGDAKPKVDSDAVTAPDDNESITGDHGNKNIIEKSVVSKSALL